MFSFHYVDLIKIVCIKLVERVRNPVGRKEVNPFISCSTGCSNVQLIMKVQILSDGLPEGLDSKYSHSLS